MNMTAGLIGRERQLRLLRDKIDGVCGGRGGLILVTGEPGVGKTALVTEAVQETRDTDPLVLIASCWDSEVAPGYWPWTQVLRQLRRRLAADVWAAIDQPSTASISALLGETQARPTDGDFAVYDAVATTLVAAAQTRPVVIVIEDLHWCDAASLRLLDFVARHTWHERILTIGTYRDDEVDARTTPVQHLVGQLTGRSKVIALTGLPPSQVGELISRMAGVAVTADVADRVHRQTGGNPLFIEQAARLWSGEDIIEVPRGVRHAIRARLDKLPTPVQRTLATAAIFGPSFNRALLAAMCGLTPPDLDSALQHAVSARLIAGAGPSRMQFVHDLIRETLYLAWEDDARAERHAEVIGTVDQNPSLMAMTSPSDLARHAFLGLPHLATDTAVLYVRAAARDAARRLAFAEAAEHQRQALMIVADPQLEVRIALDLATALYYDGDLPASARSFDNACTLARATADAESLASVALTAYRTGEPFGCGAAARSTVLREAYRRVAGGPVDDADQDPHRQAAVLVDYLETHARSRNDDESLAFCLWVRYESGLGVGTVHERAALTQEITALSQRCAESDSQSAAASLRWVTLIEQGDADYLAQFEAHLAAAAGSDTPRDRLTVHVDRAIVATLTGHFSEAEDLLARLEPTGKAVRSDWDMMGYHVRWAACLLQGRFPDAEKVLRELSGGDYPYRQVLEAVTALEQGEPDHAVQYLAQAGGPEAHPRYLAPLVLRLQAQAGAARNDPSLMEQARAALVPLRGSWLVSLFGCDIGGPADLWLATIDLAQRRWDNAIDRFHEAREQAQRLHARPWSTLAGVGLVEAHFGRGAEADGAAVVEQVRHDATSLGMIHVLRRIQRLLPAAPTASIDADKRAPYEFRWDGTTWCLTYDSHTVHLPDAKGLRDLHLLLGRPHTAVPVAAMLNPACGPDVVAAAAMGADPVLDATAVRAYRRRLGDLDDLIDRAILDDHRARVAELEEERARLLEELRTAGGLAGRTRRLGIGTERARKTVGARIRDALRRMDHQHPPLAAHFRAAVSTGTTCCYSPRSPVPWRL